MNLTSGIIEVDLHGLRAKEAVKRAKSEVNKASGAVLYHPSHTWLSLRHKDP